MSPSSRNLVLSCLTTGGAFQTDTNQSNNRHRTKLLTHWQWRGRSRCRLGLLRNTQSFSSQSAHTPAHRLCWGIQLLVPPLGNFSMLKFLTLRTSFSVFHCLPAPSISRAGKVITKTIPRDRRKLIKLMLRKCTFFAASLAPDWPVRKTTPSDNTERTARSGEVVDTIFLSRPRCAQCSI